jgi:hypothetical protein
MTEEEQDEIYMKDPDAKTMRGFIRALSIFSEHLEHGASAKYFMGAEHDILYVYVSVQQIPPSSANGKELLSLGWHPEDDSEDWAYFT